MYDAAKEAFYYGRFMDNVGIELKAEPSVKIVGKIHKNDKTMALALWNNSSEKSTVSINVDLKKLHFCDKVKEVTDLGVKLGFRKGLINPSYLIRKGILETKIESLESQDSTAILIKS